jgi:receptor-type tyrosine-protein phosphatase F
MSSVAHEVLSLVETEFGGFSITRCLELLVPGAPPTSVKAYADSSTSIRVTWEPPPANKQNGVIAYYKIFYVPRSRSDTEATIVAINNPEAREFVIDELEKWTEYRLWILAGTSVGDGPNSFPVDIKTDEDGT